MQRSDHDWRSLDSNPSLPWDLRELTYPLCPSAVTRKSSAGPSCFDNLRPLVSGSNSCLPSVGVRRWEDIESSGWGHVAFPFSLQALTHTKRVSWANPKPGLLGLASYSPSIPSRQWQDPQAQQYTCSLALRLGSNSNEIPSPTRLLSATRSEGFSYARVQHLVFLEAS